MTIPILNPSFLSATTSFFLWVLLQLALIDVMRHVLFRNLDTLRAWLLGFGLVTLLTGFIAWATVRLQGFCLVNVNLALVAVLVMFLIAFLINRSKRALDAAPEDAHLETGVLVLALALILLFYASFPIYFVLGSRDYGLYLLHAMRIAYTGTLDLTQPELRDALLKFPDGFQQEYPGIYHAARFGKTTDPGAHYPQFLAFFGSYAANFASFSGVEGAVRANSVVATASLAVFYCVARYFLKFWPAFLTMLVLALNPAFVFNARMTLSEHIAMLSLFSGMALALQAIRKNLSAQSRLSYLLWAGFALGVGQFNRIDAVMNGLVVVGFNLFMASYSWRARLQALAFSASFLIFSVGGIIDAYTFHYPYLIGHLEEGILAVGVLVSILLGVSYAIMFVPRLNALFNTYTSHLYSFMFSSLFWVTTLLFAWSYFIWRFMQHSLHDARAVWEISWYVTPFGLALCCYGLLALKRTQDRRWFVVLCPLMFSVLLFSVKPSITPDHYWATRRWIPAVFAGITLLAGVGAVELFAWLKTKKPQLAKPILALLLSLVLMNSYDIGHYFFFKPLLKELHLSYESFKSRVKLPEQTGYMLTRNPVVGTPLYYIYNVPVLILARNDIAKKYMADGAFAGYRLVDFDPAAEGLTPDFVMTTCGKFPNPRARFAKLPRRLEDLCFSLDSAIIPVIQRP